MSYQVLARKWRPSNFSQVAGQSHVLQSLINALDNERLHHAYLFTGTRGVGKTTLARILAKCLNCEEGITSTPCEKCNACTEINEGRFVDLIEVDAASRTKVDDTRELLDNVQYAPSRGRFKVYLIDEVHMLSNHSFNALLKTLEEPPPHVKFLFATTDPQKLPITILSRCLQFNLKNLSPELIEQYLVKVLDAEKIKYDEEALWQIAAAAAGSMRDALTLVDQAIAYCQGEIKTDAVVEMLGVPQHQQIIALLNSMADRDTHAVLEVVREMAEQSPDYSNTLDSLLSALHRLALAQVAAQAVDNSFGDRQALLELASKFSAEDVQLYYQIGSKGREELRLASDLRVAFEMLMLRMLVFSPRYSEPVEKGAESEIAQAATGDQKKKNSVATTKNEEQTGSSPVVSSAGIEQPAEAAEADQAAGPKDSEGSATEPVPESSALADEPHIPHTDPEPLRQASAELACDSNQAAVSLGEMDHARWLKVYFQLPVSGIVANILANSVWSSATNEHISFLLDRSQSAVYNEDIDARLAQALGDYFNSPLAVSVEIAEIELETPAALGQRIREEKQQAMIDNFVNDDKVQQLLHKFSATVAKDSIIPVTE